jgi:hypothetical protein
MQAALLEQHAGSLEQAAQQAAWNKQHAGSLEQAAQQAAWNKQHAGSLEQVACMRVQTLLTGTNKPFYQYVFIKIFENFLY